MKTLRLLLFLLSGTALPTAVLAAQEVVQALPGTTDADALAAVMRRIAGNPRDVDALVDAARLSLKLGDINAAATLLQRAENVDPRNARVKAGQGSVFLQSERPGQALRYFAQAETQGLNARNFAADRGLAYDLTGEQNRAQRDYAVALRDAPNDGETIRRYALSLGISGQRQHALQLLDPLIRKSDRAAWRVQAFVLALTGDTGGASRIAATMIPGEAAGLSAFFERLPTLPPRDRAFAVHFGEVRATPERLADARLAPPLSPIRRDPPVTLASAQPPRSLGVQPLARTAITPAAPATPLARPATVAPAPPARAAQTAPLTAARALTATAPASAPISAPAAAPVVIGLTPMRPAITEVSPPSSAAAKPSVQFPAPAPPGPAVQVLASAPATIVNVTSAPADSAAAGSTALAPLPLASVVQPVSVASIAPSASVVPVAPPAVSSARPLPSARISEESILARIIAGLSIPAAELGVEGPARAAALSAPVVTQMPAGRVQPLAAPPVNDDAAQKRTAAKAAGDKRAADRKTAAEKKALAEKRAAAEKKAIADKEAAEKKKIERANPGRIWVQVAGGAYEGDLPKAYAAVKSKAPAVFGSRGGWTTPLRATNRVLTGPFKTDAEARQFVNDLKKQGVSAFTFTSDPGQPVKKLATR